MREQFCVLCKATIQRESFCCLLGNVSPSLATASRACASCRGEGRESAAILQPGRSLACPLAGNPATAGELGTPPLAGVQLAVAQHHPFPAALLLQSQWPSSTRWPSGLQEKREISMHVPVPLGPTASRSHNSPFL